MPMGVSTITAVIAFLLYLYLYSYIASQGPSDPSYPVDSSATKQHSKHAGLHLTIRLFIQGSFHFLPLKASIRCFQ